MVDDVVRDNQFAKAKAAPDLTSPERPTMQPGEHLGSQFAGLTAGVPEVKAARSPAHVGDLSLHQYREALSGFGKAE
jgi:hypothetical protein